MNSKLTKAKILQFNKIEDKGNGKISITDIEKDIPFHVKRVFWSYNNPDNSVKGGHAHKTNIELILPITGILEIQLIDQNNQSSFWTLDNPNEGLIIPPLNWVKINVLNNAIFLVFASNLYDESDYIRDYKKFKL